MSQLRLPAVRSRAVHYWALYDFANTLFAMNVVSLYFALWVTQDMKAPDLAYSSASSIALVAVALLSPAFGAWSDRLGRRIPFTGVQFPQRTKRAHTLSGRRMKHACSPGANTDANQAANDERFY